MQPATSFRQPPAVIKNTLNTLGPIARGFYFIFITILLVLRIIQQYGTEPTSKIYKNLVVATPIINMLTIATMLVAILGKFSPGERTSIIVMGGLFVFVYGFDAFFNMTNNIKLGRKIEEDKEEEEDEEDEEDDE